MSLIDSIFSPNLDAMQTAMQLASKRQSLLVANLANANTPGYKRKDIDFNVSLAEAQGGSDGDLAKFQEADRQVESDATSLTPDGNNVDLEREVMGIAETQLRFSALTQMASTYFSDLKSAIREGK